MIRNENAGIGSQPGTYALLLSLRRPVALEVGRLGLLQLRAPYYFYAGSAFGPGGLAARLRHHLSPVRRPHWHIDYLRCAARVEGVWTTADPRPCECVWSVAAQRMRGAQPVAGFGASDCRAGCVAHLTAFAHLPSRRAFRAWLARIGMVCAPIHWHTPERSDG